jgi:hypothetical protein
MHSKINACLLNILFTLFIYVSISYTRWLTIGKAEGRRQSEVIMQAGAYKQGSIAKRASYMKYHMLTQKSYYFFVGSLLHDTTVFLCPTRAIHLLCLPASAILIVPHEYMIL